MYYIIIFFYLIYCNLLLKSVNFIKYLQFNTNLSISLSLNYFFLKNLFPYFCILFKSSVVLSDQWWRLLYFLILFFYNLFSSFSDFFQLLFHLRLKFIKNFKCIRIIWYRVGNWRVNFDILQLYVFVSNFLFPSLCELLNLFFRLLLFLNNSWLDSLDKLCECRFYLRILF